MARGKNSLAHALTNGPRDRKVYLDVLESSPILRNCIHYTQEQACTHGKIKFISIIRHNNVLNLIDTRYSLDNLSRLPTRGVSIWYVFGAL